MASRVHFAKHLVNEQKAILMDFNKKNRDFFMEFCQELG